MYRLNVWVIALAALALASCSGSSAPTERGGVGQSSVDGRGRPGLAQTEREVAVPRQGSVAPAELAALLRPGRVPAGLPALPMDLPPIKLPQRLEQSFLDGNLSFDASANATDDGATKVLDSSDGELAWVVYRLPLVSPVSEITKLHLTTSNWVPPAGGDQGWVYGLANYDTGSWQALGYTTSLTTVRTMNSTAPFRGPGDYAYLFVLTSNMQSITVNEVGFDLQIAGWEEVDLASSSLPNWTQAIDFTLTDNPTVGYTNPTTGHAWFIVGDRTKDLLNPDNWVASDIDPTLLSTLDANWIDVLVDDVTGFPRATYITEGHPAATGRTQLTFAALFPFDMGGTIWLPYALKRSDESLEDGAEYTSLARYGFGDNTFGFVTHVANDTFRSESENSFDMQLRTFQIVDPEAPGTAVNVDRTSGFGTDWLYPHLTYSDGGINHGIAVNGGNNFAGAELDKLAPILEETNSKAFASIATNPDDDTLGSTYVATPLDLDQLMYVDYDASQLYNDQKYPEQVAAVGTQSGGFIGTSQLAYAPDGTPGIVFTQSDGTSVYVKYATLTAGSWVVEDVSSDPGTPGSLDELAVIVDLAFDSTGVPAVCYNHVNGTTGTLRFAIRGE